MRLPPFQRFNDTSDVIKTLLSPYNNNTAQMKGIRDSQVGEKQAEFAEHSIYTHDKYPIAHI